MPPPRPGHPPYAGGIWLRQRLLDEGLDPDDENIIRAFFEDATLTDGAYALPVETRWSTIINTSAPQLNVALDTALHLHLQMTCTRACILTT